MGILRIHKQFTISGALSKSPAWQGSVGRGPSLNGPDHPGAFVLGSERMEA